MLGPVSHQAYRAPTGAVGTIAWQGVGAGCIWVDLDDGTRELLFDPCQLEALDEESRIALAECRLRAADLGR